MKSGGRNEKPQNKRVWRVSPVRVSALRISATMKIIKLRGLQFISTVKLIPCLFSKGKFLPDDLRTISEVSIQILLEKKSQQKSQVEGTFFQVFILEIRIKYSRNSDKQKRKYQEAKKV